MRRHFLLTAVAQIAVDRRTVLAVIIATVVASVALPSLAPAAPPAPVTATLSMPESLVRVYAGEPPRSVADLRLMNQYQNGLVAKLLPTTVAVQVGPTQGSGVIVNSEGYVLTASHVARRPGMRARIILADGRRVSGRTLGMDKNMDAGMLKIDTPPDVVGKQQWPYATMGSDRDVHAGVWCLTLGHSGGYEDDQPRPGVRLGRVLRVSGRAIETDCKLVGGDSGGPLFDMHGHVIGINSRIGADLDKNIHVPIDTYRTSWDRLIHGEAWGDLANVVGRPKPAIGVIREENSDTARVETVVPDSPAEHAGVRPGDTIVRLDDQNINSFSQLAQLVQRREPGDEIQLELLRDGKPVHLKLVLGFMTQQDQK